MIIYKNNIPKKHINKIANIHHKTFPNFYLTGLGPKFLQTFYNTLIYSEQCISYFAFNQNQPIGFAICVYPNDNIYKKLIVTNKYKYIKIGLNLLFTKPLELIKVFKKIMCSGKLPVDNKQALLLSICIKSEFQGHGIAVNLINMLEEKLKSLNAKELYLLTRKKNNDRANTFYRKLNYKISDNEALDRDYIYYKIL